MLEVPVIRKDILGKPIFVPCWEPAESSCDGTFALIWCGNGHVSCLVHHTISADGDVSPDLSCSCGWRETVRLLGWKS